MTQPFRLRDSVKRVARAVRDNPRSNEFVTNMLRPLIKAAPLPTRDAMIAHFPRVGIVSATLPDGQKLVLSSPEPESVSTSIFYGSWVGQEQEVLPWWYQLAKCADVVVDIGAHIGHFSVVAGLANQDAQIFAFEPLPRIAELLRDNVERNDLKHVSVLNCALGRETGSLPFYAISGGLPSSSSLSLEFMQSGFTDFVATQVAVSKLDDADIPRLGAVLVKIDTETTEPDVVAGGASFFCEARPIIFIEILDDIVATRLEQEFATAGYTFVPYLLTEDGPKERSAIRSDRRWRNHLLIPKGNRRGRFVGALEAAGL